jgi:predicted ATPase
LLVVTRRSGVAVPGIDRLFDDLQTKRFFVPVELPGLDAPGMRELAAHELGESPPEVLVERLAARSGGNPWSARQILVHWKELGLAKSGCWGSELQLARAGAPETVDAPLLRRLEAVSPRCRELVEVAAVFEGRFLVRHLQEVAEAAAATVTAAVDEAVEVSLFVRDGEGIRFREPALREAVLDSLPAARRRELHRRAARRLELEHLGRSREAWPIIARHYFESLPVGDVDKCLGFLRAAAEDAEARGALDVAEGLLERAQIALEQRSEPGREERRQIDAWLARLRGMRRA